jgi:hypothetical protein
MLEEKDWLLLKVLEPAGVRDGVISRDTKGNI